jgi:carboxyl-terminal processing protease
MTHAKFYRISGASNQHQGIVPDLQMVSLFDPKDVGESALANALPWDTIKPAQFNTFYNLKPVLPVIQERHRKRVSNDVDYQFLIQQSKLLEEIRGETQIMLSYDARTQEKSLLEQKRLDMENHRRKAKKLAKLESYEALKSMESKQQEEAATKVIADEDVVLFEAAEVLADMVDLQADRLLISNTNTEQEATLFDFFGEMLN